MNTATGWINALGIVTLLVVMVAMGASGRLDAMLRGEMGQYAAADDTGVNVDPIPLDNGGVLTPITPSEFKALVALSQRKPVFIMVYASWCPHCKRMLTLLNDLQHRHGQALHVATISIDNRPELAKTTAEQLDPLALDTYIVRNGDDYRAIGDIMREDGLGFQGGRRPSFGVPYNTVYVRGKPVAELNGALPNQRMRTLITDIISQADMATASP
jgi:thiol-disulfide isomerase/thioredoxin